MGGRELSKNPFYRYTGKFLRWYKHNIFPDVKDDVRGTTRLKETLEDIALKPVDNYEGTPQSIYDYSEDWDNCLIIDACRYDLYREVFPEEEIGKRVTLGSASPGYIQETYSEGDYSDVVYVTSNPYFEESQFRELTGRKLEDVFHTVFKTFETDWRSEEGRPSTESLIKDAKTARKLFPDKKVVVHFMKPHHPFPEESFPESFDKELDGTYENSVWAYGEQEVLDWGVVWEAYKDSLRQVMPQVRELGEEMDGKTVVTSDHGNLVGENGLGHHPGKTRKEKGLREVPWIEIK